MLRSIIKDYFNYNTLAGNNIVVYYLGDVIRVKVLSRLAKMLRFGLARQSFSYNKQRVVLVKIDSVTILTLAKDQ